MNLTRQAIRRLRRMDKHLIAELLEAERLSLIGSMASTVAHDLRNPVSNILMAAGILQEREKDPQLARMAGVIRRSTSRMTAMTQELLDFSRGISALHLETVAIDDLMAELDEQALDPLPAAGVRVERRLDFQGELRIDRDRFIRVLLNVIKNAVEAMPDGGDLHLATEAREEQIVFVLADTGCGIPPEVLPRIFEPFVTHGKAGGTGLGMAIVKSVVDAHRGKVNVVSTPGTGTRFEIAVPRLPSQ